LWKPTPDDFRCLDRLHPPNVYARKPPRPGGEGSASRGAVSWCFKRR
jgi:hypothetical protein